MAGHDIIVVGASAGGVEPLVTLARTLPPTLAAAVFVVLHIPPHNQSLLPTILTRAGPLPARHPTDGETLEQGRIYVAPPDHHLLVERDRVRVVHGPKENRHRPAVDPLFRSAAIAYGPRVVGIVLSGALDDGTAGLSAIKRLGGIAVVQQPSEALYPSMPQSALNLVPVDYTVPVGEMATLLVRLAHKPADEEGAPAVPDDMELEHRIVLMGEEVLTETNHPGTPSPFSCPECGGVLWELEDSQLTRYRCRVGHAFSVETMLAEQETGLETALWSALKTLEESMQMSRRLAKQARERGATYAAARFDEKFHEAHKRAELLRQVLLRDTPALDGRRGVEVPG